MYPNVITAATNSLIKAIILLHTSKGRAAAGQFIGDGLRVCTTLCANNCSLIMLFCTQETYQQASSFAPQEKIVLVNDHIMNKISPSSSPSGFVGIFALPVATIPPQLKPGLVLAQISDPGNMGTLIRSAIAFGLTNIIVVEGVDPYNPKVVQASAGTIGAAQIIPLSWQELVTHQQRPPLAALVVRDGSDITTIDKNVLLVVGNEAHGLPILWQNDCPIKATLPMSGNAESLNAAIAGSIALYLITRN